MNPTQKKGVIHTVPSTSPLLVISSFVPQSDKLHVLTMSPHFHLWSAKRMKGSSVQLNSICHMFFVICSHQRPSDHTNSGLEPGGGDLRGTGGTPPPNLRWGIAHASVPPIF